VAGQVEDDGREELAHHQRRINRHFQDIRDY